MNRFTACWLLPFALTCSLPAWAGPVNINTADATTLARELKGVGTAKAEAIVAYRQKNGLFRSVDELGLVNGIGQKLIDQNRADLRLGTAPPTAAKPMDSKPATAPAARR